MLKYPGLRPELPMFERFALRGAGFPAEYQQTTKYLVLFAPLTLRFRVTGNGAIILNPAAGGIKNLFQKEKGKCVKMNFDDPGGGFIAARWDAHSPYFRNMGIVAFQQYFVP